MAALNFNRSDDPPLFAPTFRRARPRDLCQLWRHALGPRITTLATIAFAAGSPPRVVILIAVNSAV
jgi:hypothetical protein